MEANKDQFYVYDLEKPILNSLELLYFDLETQQEVSNEITPVKPIEPVQKRPVVTDKDYYKSDLHRYNLKRSLNNLPPLTENEFDELLEKESIESISGSEDDDEDEDEAKSEIDDSQEVKLQALIKKLALQSNSPEENVSISHLNTKSAFILFKAFDIKDKALGVYKSLFNETQLLQTPLDTLKSFTTTEGSKKSALFMIGGGHFAGAIISHVRKPTRGNVNHTESKAEQAVNVIVSKTFHRYTVRKKQGGSQSASDNARGKANSAGSSIRRYNEQALIKEVRELLQEWKHHLADCTSIFLRASGAANKKIIVGYEGAPLQSNDTRIKNFPFTTKRATASELKRAWVELSYMKLMDLPKINKPTSKAASPNPELIPKKKILPEITENDKHSGELVGLLKRQKAPKLITYLKQNKINVNQFRLSPQANYVQYPTLLHYTSSHSLSHMIQIFLVNLKADPTIQNEFGKTPAEICDSSTRKIFQVARHKLGEEAWNWSAAKVGPPKSQEEVENEANAELERLKKEKQQQIQESLNKKTEMELKVPKIQSSGTVGGAPMVVNELGGLSDQQKQRIMREQRARAAEARLKRPQ